MITSNTIGNMDISVTEIVNTSGYSLKKKEVCIRSFGVGRITNNFQLVYFVSSPISFTLIYSESAEVLELHWCTGLRGAL